MSQNRSLVRGWAATTAVFSALFFAVTGTSNAEIEGHYLESRTCQVYTGPCFANAEVGLSGKNAVLAWSITDGKHGGVDLSGLTVVMAVKAANTLEFRGFEDAGALKSVVYVDHKATTAQQLALVDFAKKHSGRGGEKVVRVSTAPIEMSLDVSSLDGKLSVGEKKVVQLETRKARPEDCICSNESAYYPPLVKVDHFAPGVATVGTFNGWGLGSRWSTPGARSAYMATFSY